MQTESPLIGDLSSLPSRDRWLWDEEIYAIDQMLQMSSIEGAPVTSEMCDAFHNIIHDRRIMLERELAERAFLTQMVKGVHHQLRARSDLRQNDIVIEQWVPAVRCWLVSGRFPLDTSASIIVEALREGDPRHKTAQERLDEARAASKAVRAEIDARSTQRVLDAVDDLSPDRLDQFIAVEEALKTGETITSRGDDRRFIEAAVDRTRDAAFRGDEDAQRVLTHGIQDNTMCANPGDNPTVR